MRPITRPGAALAVGFAVVVGVAVLPAGLDGVRVPSWSWLSWAVVLVASFALVTAAAGSMVDGARRLSWLLPPVFLLTLPLALLAAARLGALVAVALMLRSLAAATAGLATVTALGPSGLVEGLRALRVPHRLVEIVHAMLVSLAAIARQVSAMLRARAARRTRRTPWSALVVAPIETLRGFGRLIGALLLRAIERAEALERARDARAGFDA